MQNVTVLLVDIFIDIIFIFDIFVGFRTTYYNQRGKEVKDTKLMAQNYLRKSFLIDLIAALPFHLIRFKESDDSQNNWAQIFEMFKFGRLLRITKIVQFLRAIRQIKGSILVLKIILFLVIYLHFFACLWWLIVSNSKVWYCRLELYDDYIYKIYTSPKSKQYLLSFYTAVQLNLGLDIYPQSSAQFVIGGCGLIIGTLTNAFVFSQLQIVLKEINKTDLEFERKLIRNKQAMLNINLPKHLQPQVLHHLTKTAPSLKVQIDVQNFLRLMPPSLVFKVIKRLF